MSDRDKPPAANGLKHTLEDYLISDPARPSNFSKRVKENPSSPSPTSDFDSDSDMDLDTPDDDDLQIYQSMLPYNPEAITFLFSPAFTAPLKAVTKSLSDTSYLPRNVILEEFRRFVAIKLFTVDTEATKTSPTPLMDQVWHAAILDTHFYATLQANIGLNIHHNPSGADSNDANDDEREKKTTARERRLAVMIGIYKAYFSSNPLRSPCNENDAPRVRRYPRIGTPIHLPDTTGMQIFVKGIKGETFTLRVRSTSLVEDIKATIEENIGIPREDQRLIWAGKQLQDGRTLAFYKIQREDTLHLVLRMTGC
ncbi:hypothetical protein BKA65DRAFT_551195 [Rhexocercosporidium sp. MPI-PUGE-AT-0058]|nr:hypothetical protein BKA65DRAFT_551195 [Rhexocercosporidium sp. MPI-PUGE-AT-0058]